MPDTVIRCFSIMEVILCHQSVTKLVLKNYQFAFQPIFVYHNYSTWIISTDKNFNIVT